MKNFKLSRKFFFLTVVLLLVNLIIFLFDGLRGFVIFWYGSIFYLPLLLLVTLTDRFYLKNRSPFFLTNIIVVIILGAIVYFMANAYVNSIFSI